MACPGKPNGNINALKVTCLFYCYFTVVAIECHKSVEYLQKIESTFLEENCKRIGIWILLVQYCTGSIHIHYIMLVSWDLPIFFVLATPIFSSSTFSTRFLFIFFANHIVSKENV